MTPRTRSSWLGGALLAAGLLGSATPAGAAELTTSQTTAKRGCIDRLAADGARGTTRTAYTATATGLVHARLTGAKGSDWDLAIFDARTRERVAGSASFGSKELAEGFVSKGQRLTIQACRLSGNGKATLTTSSKRLGLPAGPAEPIKVVEVRTPQDGDKARLQQLDLDLTEHADEDGVEVVLHSSAEERKLRAAGFLFTVKIPDLQARDRANRRLDARYAKRNGDGARAAQAADGMPSGSTSYRKLADVQNALKQLVAERPDLVRPITMPLPSLEGRPVEGVEITSPTGNRDAKPVFFQMGVHHAREWPAAELPLEFAFDLVRSYGKEDRTTRLVDATRTIVVPVINPDGYNLSTLAPDDSTSGFAYKRRNCRIKDGATPAANECGMSANRNRGTDPNRNYGGLWGGNGASSSPTSDTYRGAAPFSEPETQNVQRVVSANQVTTLITNHTYGNLVLRPPGLRSQGPAPDEEVYRALGKSMTDNNGYVNQLSYELYDTSGTTEDWSYFATGGLGFTFESGPDEFHPPYEEVVGMYRGTGAQAGKGNREAYFAALENTANAERHSVLAGASTPGATLRLKKSFATSTSKLINAGEATGSVLTFPDVLETTMTVPADGRYEWHVNPSTRPIVPGGRVPNGPPTAGRDIRNTKMTVPGGGQETTANVEDFPVTIAPTDDNGLIRASIQHPAMQNKNLNLKLLRRVNGSLVEIARSTNGPNLAEELRVVNPPAGEYVVRVINVTAVDPSFTGKIEFASPEPPESWRMTCEVDGRVLETRDVVVNRGERVGADICPVARTEQPGATQNGTTPGGTTPTSPTTPGTGTVTTGPFRLAIAADRRRLKRALARGFRVRVRCGRSCTLRTKVQVDAATGRRYGLTRRTAAVKVGGAQTVRTPAGRRTYTVRFTKKAARRLRRARSLRFTVVVTASGENAAARTARKTLRLR
ncbi:MAG: Carboxypeptidase T precursor [uncultured Solirubrobacteraceae bacterium]|uniref:Carboxypeptidase T n=1 Tax=uncultured Solirubrobacteraceae bacterium TaxID=1162706 RepID=A0A6J4SPP6_9ACTN|nr:MAG: Carboxypeptidase T precursor [uncultured Solirubrobacteraceae bacterium]